MCRELDITDVSGTRYFRAGVVIARPGVGVSVGVVPELGEQNVHSPALAGP
jgi:hypothetical protein